MEEVPIKPVYLVAWKIDKALFKFLILEILLASLDFFNISAGFIDMTTIAIRRDRIAITIRSSISVKDLLDFNFWLIKNILSYTLLFYHVAQFKTIAIFHNLT